jgi:hypothetical protein
MKTPATTLARLLAKMTVGMSIWAPAKARACIHGSRRAAARGRRRIVRIWTAALQRAASRGAAAELTGASRRYRSYVVGVSSN